MLTFCLRFQQITQEKILLTEDNKYVILTWARVKHTSMFEIVFYRDKNGKSEIVDYLDELKDKANTDKNARINKEKILAYMAVLTEYGTRIGEPFVKHIEGNLWELRPLSNRIFFFCWKDNKFIMVHHFIKKSQKTPKKELEKARKNMQEYMERNSLQ